MRFLTRHGWFGLTACVLLPPKYTQSISDPKKVESYSQGVRDFFLNLLTGFLTLICSIRTLSLCVVCPWICLLDFWPQHGWFGFSVSNRAWFLLESIHSISNLKSQDVRVLLSNPLKFWQWHGWLAISVCAWFPLKSTDWISDFDMVDLDSQPVRGLNSNLLTQISDPDMVDFGLSDCAWFFLESTHSIPDSDTVD